MARFSSPRFRISSQQQLLLLKLYEDGPAPVAALAASIFSPGINPQPATAAATRACAATARRSARRLAENGLVNLWKAPHPKPATAAGGNLTSVLWAELLEPERVRWLMFDRGWRLGEQVSDQA